MRNKPQKFSMPCHITSLPGPCMSTDTACSSSLVAAHLACCDLLARRAARGVAAGANLMLSPATPVAICSLQALSRSGRCLAFDSGAEGYGRGEGVAAVSLRRWSATASPGFPVISPIARS